MIAGLLWAVLGGTVLGVLGKLLAPDAEEVPLWLTVLCGIGGCLLGDVIYRAFWEPQTRGVDWWRHGWQVGVAAALVVLAAAATSGRRA